MTEPALPVKRIAMPLVTFLFTIDQIAAMVNLSLHDVQYKYLYYNGRSSGRKPRHQMLACNIAPDNEDPDWRVNAQDFTRWLRSQGWEVKHSASL